MAVTLAKECDKAKRVDARTLHHTATKAPHVPIFRHRMSHSDADLAAWARTRLGHDFASVALLRRALTHSSAATSTGNYQRLEFLGDRVLGCAVAAWLYADHDEAEGRLTARLHALVEGPANAEVARSLGVPERLIIEQNARAKGLHQSENVLGDVAEALVAALYLDGGWAVADAFVRREWAQLLADGPRLLIDPKSRLQEWALKRRRGMPIYALIDRQGPDHAPRFTIEASVRGETAARGEGSNKQEAEKAAATNLLEILLAKGAD
jgi:ribonuclease-3